MPTDFPDMRSLEQAAECWKFRSPKDGESQNEYRTALADFIKPKDHIESMEIRHGRGWDKWSKQQGIDALTDKAGAGPVMDLFLRMEK